MGKIFLASDWHLVKYDKETGLTYQIPEMDEIIDQQCRIVTDDDIFIFMGDMVDAEITDPPLDKIRTLKGGTKIFIRGNNDVMSDEVLLYYYKFDYVYKGIIIPERHIVLSHTSIEMGRHDSVWANVHGHIHRDGWDCDRIPYYHSPYNNINICNRGKTTFPIDSIDVEKEKVRNNNYSSQNEKPMATYLQNSVRAAFELWRDLGECLKVERIEGIDEEMWGII